MADDTPRIRNNALRAQLQSLYDSLSSRLDASQAEWDEYDRRYEEALRADVEHGRRGRFATATDPEPGVGEYAGALGRGALNTALAIPQFLGRTALHGLRAINPQDIEGRELLNQDVEGLLRSGYDVEQGAIQAGMEYGAGSPEQLEALVPLAALGIPGASKVTRTRALPALRAAQEARAASRPAPSLSPAEASALRQQSGLPMEPVAYSRSPLGELQPPELPQLPPRGLADPAALEAPTFMRQQGISPADISSVGRPGLSSLSQLERLRGREASGPPDMSIESGPASVVDALSRPGFEPNSILGLIRPEDIIPPRAGETFRPSSTRGPSSRVRFPEGEQSRPFAGRRHRGVSPELERSRVRGETSALETQQFPRTKGDVVDLHEVERAMETERLRHIAREWDKAGRPSGLGERGFIISGQGRAKPLAPYSQQIESLFQKPSAGIRRTAIEQRAELGRYALQQLVHSTAGLERATQQLTRGAKLPAHLNPAELAQAASGTSQRFQRALLHEGPVRYDSSTGSWTPTGTRSLRDIIYDIPEAEIPALDRYLIARRAVEVARERGFDITNGKLDAARAEVASAPRHLQEAAVEITEWLNDALDYWVEAGGLDPALAAKLRSMYTDYIPIYRVLEEGGRQLTELPGGLRVGQPVKRLGEGPAQFVRPLEAVIDYAHRMYRAGDLSRPVQALADLAEQNPEAARGLIEPVQIRPAHIALKRAGALQRLAAERGIELSGDEAVHLVQALEGEAKARFTDNIALVWRNGRREAWQVAPDVADSLRAMTPPQFGFFTQLFGAPGAALRTGVTTHPVFAVFNFMRDQFTAYAQSKYGFNPFTLDGVRALAEIYAHRFYRGRFGEHVGKRSPSFEEFEGAGGGFGISRSGQGIFGGTLSTLPGKLGDIGRGRELKYSVHKVTDRAGTKFINEISHPIEALRTIFGPFEEATRYAEFKKARATGASQLEALRASQDVTVNFANRGASQTLASIAHSVPFLNPGIQGFNYMIKSARANPAKFLFRAAAPITSISIALWWLNQDDEEIKELRRTEAGANYWFVRLPNEEIVRFPKPFLLGQLFGTGIENVLDGDPEAGRDFAKAFLSQAELPILPTAAAVGVGLFSNRDPFFQVPIEPEASQDIQSWARARPETGSTARELYQRLGTKSRFLFGLESPARFEFVTRQLGGRLGSDALRFVDTALDALSGTAPERILAERAIMGGFFARVPSSNTRSIREFYRRSHRATEAAKTLSNLQRRNPRLVAEFQQHNLRELTDAVFFEAGNRQLTELRSQIDLLRQSSLDPVEKRTQINSRLSRMNEVARAYLDALKAREEQ